MNALFQDPGLVVADAWQRDFPLCPSPFAAVAAAHDLTESEVISSLTELRQRGMLSRIGAVVRPNTVGASTLAAVSCHASDVERVAATISAEPFVNHNYERSHAINLWFVAAAPSQRQLSETLDRISKATGLRVLDLRLERPYHIDLGFGLSGQPAAKPAASAALRKATVDERALLAEIEGGLPVVPRPYAAIAARIGWSEKQVIAALTDMTEARIISRFGCVIRHRAVGYTANAMAVWDVPGIEADSAGHWLAREDGVTLCYRRNRSLPSWPYNLFAMIHGRDEATVRRRIAEIARNTGLSAHPGAILFSTRCFTQRGARFSGRTVEAAA